jgi:hypothetical protein
VKVTDENWHVQNHYGPLVGIGPLPTIKLELRKMTTDLLSLHFLPIGTIHLIFIVAVVMKVVGPD